MIAVGIDISKGRSTVAVVGEGKKLLHKPFDVLHNKTAFADLVSLVQKFGDDTCVVMEHTGVYYRVVAEIFLAAGLRVSVVNPVLIRQFGNNTLRKVSTDKTASMKIANYALENRAELRDYAASDILRDNLKSFVRQYAFEDKTLTAHKNSLIALLERVFPSANELFTSPVKPDGHQKWVDFVIEFWHNDCVAALSLKQFIAKYKKFCKKNGYLFNEKSAQKIHGISCENLTTLPKDDTTRTLVQGAANRVLQISENVESLRSEMITRAKQLPEFDAVDALYGVGETLSAQLIGEVGDVRRFESKRSLVAFAGVDPGKDDSGQRVSISGKISRSGDALLRKFVFQAVEIYLLKSPADEPVYQFLDKKRSEGKQFYVYMTAACNKFLRIYYARVKEYMDSLETVPETEAPSGALEAVDSGECIANAPEANNNIAFTCVQDSAPVETDTSGAQGLAYTNGAVKSKPRRQKSATATG